MTTIPVDASKFSRSVYSVELQFLPSETASESQATDLTRAVESMERIRDYDANTLPHFRFVLKAPKDNIQVLIDKHDGGKLVLTVRRMILDSGEDSGHRDPLDTTMDHCTLNILDIKQVGEERVLAGLVIDCVPRTPLEILRKTHNRVFHDCRLDWCVAALVQEAKPTDGYKFYMTPLDNSKEYEAIMVPPGSLSECVEHIDQVHGLYEGRLLQFYDLKEGYIMGSNHFLPGALPEKLPNGVIEYVPVVLAEGAVGTYGSAEDEEAGAMRLRIMTEPVIPRREPAMREEQGTDAKLLTNSQDTVVSQTECRNLEVISGAPAKGRERIMWNRYDNPMIPARMRRARYEALSPITIVGKDYDLAFWSPAREYKFVTTQQPGEPAEGQWRLSGVQEIFRRKAMGDDLAMVQCVAVLKPAGEPGSGGAK